MKNIKKKTGQPPPNQSMYQSLDIQGFCQFKSAKIDNLNKINLFLGPNNSGKTSLLEAIFTHACGLNWGAFHSTILSHRSDSTFRGAFDYGEKVLKVFRTNSEPPFSFQITGTLHKTKKLYKLMAHFSPSSQLATLDPRTIETTHNLSETPIQSSVKGIQPFFVGKWESKFDNNTKIFDVTFPPENSLVIKPFKLGYIQDILSHRVPLSEITIFSYLKRYGILNKFTEEMKKAFLEVNQIDMIPFPDGNQGLIYIKTHDNELLPLSSFGDGMRRWYHLLGYLVAFPNSVHCIEEIDAAFHPGVLDNLTKLLVQYANNYNNQIFLTSHSIEFADIFLESLYGDEGTMEAHEECVSVYTVSRLENGEHTIRMFSGRDAYDRRSRFELELRG